MKNDDPYVPLSERLNQDVWHDNFVPRYSALATATPSRVVLIGVWMIFAPLAVGSAAGMLAELASPDSVFIRIFRFCVSAFFTVLFVAIVYQQTRRFLAGTDLGDIDDEGD